MRTVQLMKANDYGNGGGAGSSHWQQAEDLAARSAKTGVRILMAVISSLFFLFIVAFMIRSQIADWEHLSAPWKPLADPWRLWLNTIMLVLGSVCLQWSRVSARNGRVRRAVEGLILAGIFTFAFLIGQIWVWQQLVGLGYYMSGNPANSFFYLLTGLHAMHLLGGLVAWFKTTLKAWRGVPVQVFGASVELCAMYWHYLLGLWFVLLGLLTSSPETYAALARLCGF